MPRKLLRSTSVLYRPGLPHGGRADTSQANQCTTTLSNHPDRVFLEPQTQKPYVVRPHLQHVQPWNLWRRSQSCRRLRPNPVRRNRAPHRRHLRAVPIHPPVIQHTPSRHQAFQQRVRHLESGSRAGCRWRIQRQPVRDQPVRESPQRHALQIDRREAPAARVWRDRAVPPVVSIVPPRLRARPVAPEVPPAREIRRGLPAGTARPGGAPPPAPAKLPAAPGIARCRTPPAVHAGPSRAGPHLPARAALRETTSVPTRSRLPAPSAG